MDISSKIPQYDTTNIYQNDPIFCSIQLFENQQQTWFN